MDTMPSLETYARERGRLKVFAESKVGAGLILAAAMAAIAWLSGVSAIPANDVRQDQRIGVVEGEVRTLREDSIRNAEIQKQILATLRDVQDDVKVLRRR